MGTGIAQVAALAGEEVILWDLSAEARQKSWETLQFFINKLGAKGKLSESEVVAALGRFSFVEKLESLAEAELCIEAIVENEAIKKDVFKQLEGIVSEDCILASNTSSIPITSIAAACANPKRVVGLHFFNPAPLMKLVELIPAIQTDAAVVLKLHSHMENWGKIPVQVKDTPGFIVNRVARPFYSEAIRIYEEGIASIEEIDACMKQYGGFRMGPFELMDFIGHQVNYRVTESMYNAFFGEARYKPSFTQLRLVQAGFLGRATGKGFYTYPRPEQSQIELAANLKEDVFERILFMLINEAADASFWQIASVASIDHAMRYGVNYPKGLLRWADELGIDKISDRINKLYDTYQEERYRLSPLLRKMTILNTKFYN